MIRLSEAGKRQQPDKRRWSTDITFERDLNYYEENHPSLYSDISRIVRDVLELLRTGKDVNNPLEGEYDDHALRKKLKGYRSFHVFSKEQPTSEDVVVMYRIKKHKSKHFQATRRSASHWLT